MSENDYLLTLFHEGKPVVVRGAAGDWPAIREWSLDNLRARFGPSVQNRVPDVGEPLFNEHGEVVARYDPAVHGRAPADPSAHVQWQVRNDSISLELQRDYDTPAFLAGIQTKGVFESGHGTSYKMALPIDLTCYPQTRTNSSLLARL